MMMIGIAARIAAASYSPAFATHSIVIMERMRRAKSLASNRFYIGILELRT
jgi:hypothetical protein